MLNVVILAAGQGKRMNSNIPKVLHSIAGKPVLQHVINTAQTLNPHSVYVVYGHAGEQILEKLGQQKVNWVKQAQQLGTGHAVAQAITQIEDNARVMVLAGDVPLISVATLQKLIANTAADHVGLITVNMSNPTGLGRILRDAQQNVIGNVEEKDATPEQKKIQEINSGILIAPAKLLKHWLSQIKNNNAQGEYYLPDIIALAVAEQVKVIATTANSAEEIQGINDREQLALAERIYQMQKAKDLMAKGVTLLDPSRFDLRGELKTEKDVTIDINVIIEGNVAIGANSYIGPHVILKNVTIGSNVEIKSHCIIEDAVIGDGGKVGPFARIRPGTKLANNVHIGNFVEVKNSEIAENSKANHLSYIGDATVGCGVNIGAGVITCNYDGANKNRTIIEDEVFVGSNVSLVAPITVGKGATIGAGSTLAEEVPADALTLTRAERKTKADWQRPKKK